MGIAGRQLLRVAVVAALLLVPALRPAHALKFEVSGFASLTAGDVLNGTHAEVNGYHCPCYMASYEYAEFYQDDGWTLKPESLIGVQGNLEFNRQFVATAQLVYRGQTYKTTPDWLYLSYKINQQWTVQAGRKRLPLYYYSDYNYIGYAYPWVRPPVDVYGWEIYDYDGANVTYRNEFGDWSLEGQVYGGERSTKNNLYEEQIYNFDRTHESWLHIGGGFVNVSNQTFDFRWMFQYNLINETEYPPGAANAVRDVYHGEQYITGLAFNVDDRGFLLRSEANIFMRPGENNLQQYAPSYLVGAGYRYRDLVGMVTESWYYERRTQNDPTPQRNHTHIFSLRWDFLPSWAAKMEYDIFRDNSVDNAFYGNSQLLTLSINTVF
jgi:hypothetical protein